MAIVTAERVNAHLSNPQWNESQWLECERLCEEKEGQLASKLFGAKITPVAYSETVAILETGLVATRWPVHTVTAIDTVTVPSGGPLPEGWLLQEHRLRRAPDVGLSAPTFSLYGGYGGIAPRVAGLGSVTVSYMAGWGPVPALLGSILEKVAAVMRNRHDDSIVITDDGQARPVAPLREDWTTEEIEALGIYRNLAAWR